MLPEYLRSILSNSHSKWWAKVRTTWVKKKISKTSPWLGLQHKNTAHCWSYSFAHFLATQIQPLKCTEWLCEIRTWLGHSPWNKPAGRSPLPKIKPQCSAQRKSPQTFHRTPTLLPPPTLCSSHSVPSLNTRFFSTHVPLFWMFSLPRTSFLSFHPAQRHIFCEPCSIKLPHFP